LQHFLVSFDDRLISISKSKSKPSAEMIIIYCPVVFGQRFFDGSDNRGDLQWAFYARLPAGPPTCGPVNRRWS
jgi:hypothetical protein